MTAQAFSFKDLGIKPNTNGVFVGQKIQIQKLFNKQIIVHAYRIENSKYEGKGRCLTMQVSVDGVQRVVFNGSVTLMEMIEQVPKDKFPFTTTIVQEGERYEFT